MEKRKPIILLRGVHMNEKSAFEIAKQVYENIFRRGFEVQLLTIDYPQSMWSVFDQINGNEQITTEEFEKMVEHKAGSTREDWMVEGMDRETRIYSFHNYPVEFPGEKFAHEDIQTGVFNKNNVGVIHQQNEGKKFGWEGFTYQIFSWFSNLTYFEIPAFLNRFSCYNIPAVRKSSLATYLFDVDLERTKQEGLMDPNIAEEITKYLLWKDYK